MSVSLDKNKLNEEQKQQFTEQGYLIVKGVFSSGEVADIKKTFMNIYAGGTIPGYFEPESEAEAQGDPLRLYPRILYPHRISEAAKKYMLQTHVLGIIEELLEDEPLSAQSMFYFKPPGSRGQALHQDNYYLKVEPGSCIAAWIAIDAADEENGGLRVVPRTQHLDIQCPHEADSTKSFFRDEVDLPEGSIVVPANLEPGDVLFFNGSTIHGSLPNYSKTRFRRSFICHYVGASILSIGKHISDDLYNGQGEVVNRARNENGGPCGVEFAGAPH
ncbi:phytanoyl-CoA dioxygenase family protein [Paenibacillus psychroresistens]|uniref:Phytanoyl-CoA dioxygenase family protein n=1 Tax=Paenibacillus psychroresistens TaxID=1778678 RepID=A0A6B8RE72_9BACL|nr:phytanoyl-CoA dioxygenase family protein [Paenibacillus psychroresistens]QGQ94460.1 phytanoyl-CoA dioxygenase family protein [Paenibacillus psychroresistens]